MKKWRLKEINEEFFEYLYFDLFDKFNFVDEMKIYNLYIFWVVFFDEKNCWWLNFVDLINRIVIIIFIGVVDNNMFLECWDSKIKMK